MQKKQKISQKNTPSYSTVAVIIATFVLMLSGALFSVYLHDKKQYDPALENKLEMKTIPKDVKKEIANAKPSINYRVPVFLYHYVEYVTDKKDTKRQALNINPYIFEQQIITLKSAGYTFITASELGEVLDGKKQMPKKPILLTFDDGHRDFYTDAFPILKKYNVKSTAYIITGFLGGSDFMDPDQVQIINNSGIVEVGDHTAHHVYMKGQTLKIDNKEVSDSKSYLELLIGKKIVSFAYPYGAFDKQAIDVVKNAGFTNAVSTLPGIIVNDTNRYFIERIRPGARMGTVLTNFLDNYKQPPQTSISISE